MCLLLPQAQPGGEELRHRQQGAPRYQTSLGGMEALAGGSTISIHHPHRSQESPISVGSQET